MAVSLSVCSKARSSRSEQVPFHIYGTCVASLRYVPYYEHNLITTSRIAPVSFSVSARLHHPEQAVDIVASDRPHAGNLFSDRTRDRVNNERMRAMVLIALPFHFPQSPDPPSARSKKLLRYYYV